MKKFLVLSSVLLCCLTMSAQTSYELISAEPKFGFGNMFPYQPMDTLVSDAPKGFEPFYISHFGRHGSRFDTQATSKLHIMEVLQKYHDKGMFTETGEQMYQDLLKIRKATDGNEGTLTNLGGLEHRQIADRMYRHYKTVFDNGKSVDTYSTTSGRVKESRANFLAVLSQKAPNLKIEEYLGKDDQRAIQEVIGRNMTKEEAETLDQNSTVVAYWEKIWEEWTPDQFPTLIFKDPSQVDNMKMFIYQVLGAVKCCYCMDDMPDMAKYFSTNELYHCWRRANLVWFSRHGITPDNSGVRALVFGKNITEAIIDDAQDAIRKPGKVAATLRFSHDGYLHPLASYLDIEETNVASLEAVTDHARDFDIVRTGANLQFIFYRNKKGVVLVKALRNEKECKISDLKPYEGNYYLWKDVKKFWENRNIESMC